MQRVRLSILVEEVEGRRSLRSLVGDGGEKILVFFFGGLPGVGGGVVVLMMIGAGSMVTVFFERSCVMVALAVSGRVCVDCDGTSFSIKGDHA